MKAPPGWKFDPFADVRMGRSLFELSPEDWLVRDTDGSPEGTDPQGLDGEAATAGAAESGIAQPTPSENINGRS